MKPIPVEVFVKFNGSGRNPALLLRHVKAAHAIFCTHFGDCCVVVTDHDLKRKMGGRDQIFVMTGTRQPPVGATLVSGRNWPRGVARKLRGIAEHKAQLASENGSLLAELRSLMEPLGKKK